MPETLHLIDASPYVFRAYYSLPESLTDPGGRSVNAVYGFAGFLLRYLSQEKPTHVAACFDESLNTSFRNDVFPEYKAQREEAPQSLKDQLSDCQELCRALGIRAFSDDRYEADDLIATLLASASGPSTRGVVVSSDKDLAQLVTSDVEFFDFAREERYGIAGVREKFGVDPHQIPDFLGLAGDAVDNIPGVPKVGKKTAVALLNGFADLDDLYANLGRVAELEFRGARTMGARLSEHREIAFLSRDLARLALDAPASATLDELRYVGAKRDLVDALFERLGFEKMRNRIEAWA